MRRKEEKELRRMARIAREEAERQVRAGTKMELVTNLTINSEVRFEGSDAFVEITKIERVYHRYKDDEETLLFVTDYAGEEHQFSQKLMPRVEVLV